MGLWRRIDARLRSTRTWIALGILAPVGMVAVSAILLADLRDDAWDKADRTAKNLLQVIEGDIARNVEMMDLSLQAVVDNIKAPGIDAVGPELRQLILFDRATTARDFGVVLIVDAHGDVATTSRSTRPERQNLADREYFRVHAQDPGRGLYIGPQIVSRLTGDRVIPLSRRIDKPDGTFAGVAVGTLKLNYLRKLFERVEIGPDSAINLYHRDGTRIMRHPSREADMETNLSGQPTFERLVNGDRSSFVGASTWDGAQRYFSHVAVGGTPLILDVALSTAEIEAQWRGKAVVIGAVVLVLCGLAIGLALLFGRELRRREVVEAELARLSFTDALTGLPNRRRFDETLPRAQRRAARVGAPLALLMVDADHFKRVNDRWGHAVGDRVLKALAASLQASAHRPDDLVCRVGGEEFVVLLPETDEAGALRVAERIHAGIAARVFEPAGLGAVTVSIGLACATLDTGAAAAPDLCRRADAALYAAKAAGRNRTCAAEPDAHPRAALRLVGTRS